MHKARADLALLLVLLGIVGGIIVLLALHDAVPPELWAIAFGTLTAAGVAVPTASVAGVSATETAVFTAPRPIPPPPPPPPPSGP